MNYSKELNFAQILRNKPISKNLVDVFSDAYNFNKKIFKKSPKKFRIIICETEEEIKKHTKYFHKWSTASIELNGDLVTRSPKFVELIGKWKRKDFPNLMFHEINHIFYRGLFGNDKPLWLCEGLACFAGKNFILNKKELKKILNKYEINYKILDHRLIRNKFKNGHFPRYPIWANFVDYLIDEYSLSKLSDFLKEYQTNPCLNNYHKKFKLIFGVSERILFNRFIESIKKDFSDVHD